ncbi:hypothetical protein CRUP_022665 [Coryphaenoides rupestris]|nr:hypothetical protein CRUP_022665 [Coryphaenoides rupestris]
MTSIIQEAVLTALEALLVSLYGYRSPSGSAPLELDTPTPAGPPRSPHGARDTSPTEWSARTSEHVTRRISRRHPRVALRIYQRGSNTNHPTTNSNSSSSSVAKDWIVNQMGCFGGNLLDEDNAALSSPGKLFAPPGWRRQKGDAIRREPLQPVRIHQVPVGNPGKKPLLNAIAEKRASLTAYDLISSRTARAPLSAVAMFEREARAGVLRERPAASLQEISDVVRERWKNLGEEERKK